MRHITILIQDYLVYRLDNTGSNRVQLTIGYRAVDGTIAPAGISTIWPGKGSVVQVLAKKKLNERMKAMLNAF